MVPDLRKYGGTKTQVLALFERAIMYKTGITDMDVTFPRTPNQQNLGGAAMLQIKTYQLRVKSKDREIDILKDINWS